MSAATTFMKDGNLIVIAPSSDQSTDQLPPTRSSARKKPQSTSTTTVKQARKLTDIIPQQKYEICLYKEDHPNASIREMLLHFSKKWSMNIAPTIITKTLKDKERWFQPVTAEQKLNRLEERLAMWHTKHREQFNFTDQLLREKANTMAENFELSFRCTDAWLEAFKSKHEIECEKVTSKMLNIDLAYLDTDRDDLLPTNEKVHFLKENEESTVRVSAPISEDEACQGLLLAMGHLASYKKVSAGRIDTMWDILQGVFKNKISGAEDGSSVAPPHIPPNMNKLCDSSPSMQHLSEIEAGSIKQTPDGTTAVMGSLLKGSMEHSGSLKREETGMEIHVGPHDGAQVCNENGMISIKTADSEQYYLVQMASGNYEVVRKVAPE